MWTRAFWRAAAERAAKTFAQFLLVLLVPAGTAVVQAGTVDVFAVNWLQVLGYCLGGALLSVAMSMASAASTGDDSPSLVSGGRHSRPE